MSWTAAGRRLMGDGRGSAPYANHHQHGQQHHHHIHPRGLLSSGGGPCPGMWRQKYLMVLVAALVAFLVVNMLLLVPHLHAQGPSSGSSSGSRGGSSTGWHLTGWSSAGAASAAASAAVTTVGDSAASVGSRQQRLQRGSGVRPSSSGDFMADFDLDSSGTLDPQEFTALMQEACRNDRASLGLLSSLSRLIRLAFGLRPRYIVAGSEPYPCSLGGELADAGHQAAAALNRGFRGGGGGSSGGGKRGWSGRHSRGDRGADSAAGAAAVDPDSPEGRAAAQRASLLAKCSPLTPELAAAAAPHGTLLVVAADWGMFELFGINWLTHVQRSGLDNYLLAALDQKTAEFLGKHKLGRCISWNPQEPAGGTSGMLPAYTPPAASPGSRQHAVLSWVVLQVAQVLLGWEYDVIVSHLDTVWLTDPQPYLAAYVPPAADVVLSSAAPAPAAVMASRSAGLAQHPAPGGPVSAGVAFIRGSRQGHAAVSAWLDAHAAQVAAADAAAAKSGGSVNSSAVLLPQDIIGAWLAGVSGRGKNRRAVALVVQPHPAEPKSLLLVGPRPGLLGSLLPSATRSRGRGAGVGLFSPVAVSNSYSWFVQGVGSRAAAVVARSSSSAASGRKLPLAVHVGGGHDSREGRLHQMREAQWYADGPRYYSDPKLLSFELVSYASPEVSAGLANAPDFNQGAQLALHLASLAHQLQQFYAGAVLASALGRVLVLPNFQCYCYRDVGAVWRSTAGSTNTAWSCRAPGDDNSVFPFNCTLDQVLDPAVLYAHRAVFGGKPLLFRESTFLRNARSPSWIRHAATTIRSGTPTGCPDEAAPCAQVLPGKPPVGVNQQVVVPASLTEGTLTEVLAPFSAAKWLHFTDVTTVSGGFANPSHRAEFEAWLDDVVVPWCCKPAGDDGSGSGSTFGAARDDDGVVGDAFEAGGGNSPLHGIVELPTIVPGWVAIEVKARPVEQTATA